VLRCEKSKDAAPFADLPLRLETVTLTGGETSCVVTTGTVQPETLTPAGHKALRALGDLFDADGATFSEWWRNAGMAETSFRRLLNKCLVPGGFVTAPSPPKSRGGKYTLTATGRAEISSLTATANGGDGGPQKHGFSAYRHSPPLTATAATTLHSRQPPPPLGGGGDVAVGGGGAVPEGEV
jgi:hypothetical protein